MRTNQSAAPARIQMLTMHEVADRLGVSLQRAYEMGRAGLLPIVRMGRQIRVEETRLMSLDRVRWSSPAWRMEKISELGFVGQVVVW